ncbi:manganese efflux pump MntP [Clostridium sp. JNZ J1-5]
MNFMTIVLIAVGLSMDAFAVSITNGIMLEKLRLKEPLKIGGTFGVFQGVMPLIGWLIGSKFQGYISELDHWIAFLLLGFIGGKMIYESIKSKDEAYACRDGRCDVLNNKTLILLAVATSIDALVVGVSLALLNISIIKSAVIIGIITFVICFIGVIVGKKFGYVLKNHAEIIGGIILILIGLKILNEHINIMPVMQLGKNLFN